MKSASAHKEKITLLNKVTSKSVLKNTNQNWDQWIQILNISGAKNWPHKQIVAFLRVKYKLTPWWQQVVASAYEVHIGRKIEGRNEKGEYATVATKTIHVSGKTAWKFLTSAEGLAMWLKPLGPLKLHLKEQYEAEGGIFGEIRTMKAPERIRLTWQDTEWEKPTIIQFLCHARDRKKCMVIIQHEKLKDLRLKNQMLTHWKSILDDIANHFSA